MYYTAQVTPCSVYGEGEIKCNGTVYVRKEEPLTIHDEWFWIYLSIYIVLVLVAGLMSGLTMGLLSLDLTTLKIFKESGTNQEQKYAKRILPLISRHHLLLVTLLLVNAAAVESMPIFLDKISNPIMAIVVSVTAVLLFGECNKWAEVAHRLNTRPKSRCNYKDRREDNKGHDESYDWSGKKTNPYE